VKVHNISSSGNVFYDNEMIAIHTLALNNFKEDDLLLQALAGSPPVTEIEMISLEMSSNDDVLPSEDEISSKSLAIKVWTFEQDDSPSDNFPS
jgi:hypothetical protein